ncbi:hypothetical protein SGPA1_20416 [Streptomyces misionensis JCM 4497]
MAPGAQHSAVPYGGTQRSCGCTQGCCITTAKARLVVCCAVPGVSSCLRRHHGIGGGKRVDRIERGASACSITAPRRRTRPRRPRPPRASAPA